MESRLPKPSMLKKPIQRVPTDRLVATSNTSVLNASKQISHRMPLTRNFENVCHDLGQIGTRKRHASPEFRTRDKDMHRPKMRRSRSVSDLGHMNQAKGQPIKRPAFHMPAPFKFPPRGGVENAVPEKLKAVGGSALPKPKTLVNNSTLTKPKPAETSKVVFKPKVGTARPAIGARTASKEPTGGDAVKKAVKRIPPYDFKARFLDLQEKHKALRDKHQHLQEQLGELDTLPEQYEECQAELYKVKTDLKNVQVELECMKRQNNANNAKIEELTVKLTNTTEDFTKKLADKTEEFRISDEKCTVLDKENREVKKEIFDLKSKTENLTTENMELLEQVTYMKERLFKFNIERKELHNTIMDLRGNIRVFCRVRPPLPSEIDRQLCSWQYHDETALEISNVDAAKKLIKHDFSFDQVFPPNSNQIDIFDLVSPLIQSALDGYNVCIFAYGQTGSGKTYTMDGANEEFGIIPRTIDLLFECFQQNKSLGWEYEVKASFLEIYNEVLFDLLSNDAKDMDIKMVSAKSRMEIFVSNLTEVTVSNGAELHRLMEMAKLNRATASTVGNERSSRSHAVTRIQFTGVHADKNEVSVGCINLIDLAGSESPKTSVRMDETKKINKSLSELTNVIMALLQRNDHVPYRNSKLTHLLMPSLGGNSKTLMFINVSPFQDCFVETVKSLRFAASVNSCKIAKAKKNKYYAPNTASSGNSNLSSSISSN